MYEVSKIAEVFLHRVIFNEDDTIVNLKEDIAQVPDTAKFDGVEPFGDFSHEVIFRFTERKEVK